MEQHLLRPQGKRRRMLGGERKRLVKTVRVKRLGATGRGRERLQRDADEIDLGLLSRQRRAAGLRMEAEHQAALVLGAKAVAHKARPHPACRSELRDLLEDIVVRIEEEGQARREGIDVEPAVNGSLHVGEAVGERKRQLLDRRRTGLADVIPGDRDRVETRQTRLGIANRVDRQTHRRARRIDVIAARRVLLEDVVLDRAAQLLGRNTLALARQFVEQQQDRGGRIDRHRRRNVAERNALEEALHILDRVDRDTRATNLAEAARIVRIETQLRWQVEGRRKTRLTTLEQELEALVRLLRRGKAGVLTHRPRTASIAIRAHATRVRKLAGRSDRSRIACAGIERLDGDARFGGDVVLAHKAAE